MVIFKSANLDLCRKNKQFGVGRNGRDEGSSRICELLGMPQESKASSVLQDTCYFPDEV